MVVTEVSIQKQYPLHFAIWQNDEKEMERLLKDFDVRKEHLEKLDPRGRTPLLLAILKGNLPIVERLLYRYDADAMFTQESGWSVIHEAVSKKNKDLLKMVLMRRDIQKTQLQEKLIPDFLNELKNAPDFYVEMKWEFSIWVPLMSRMLPPGQRHRIYKRGSSLRVDSSSSDSGWDDGMSLIFKDEGTDVIIVDIDHAAKRVVNHVICSSVSLSDDGRSTLNANNYEKSVSLRLSNPSVASVMLLKSAYFKRKQKMFGGYGNFMGENIDITEDINGFSCQPFASYGFGFEAKLRSEHLSPQEKSKIALERKPGILKRVMSYFSKYDVEHREVDDRDLSVETGKINLLAAEVTAEEYFDKNLDLGGRDVGGPKEVKSKVILFDATVWICQNYPLNLKEQLVPIINMMALTNSRFKSLKEFIELKMPSGFPIKLEVPIHHFLKGRISFHNIFGTECTTDGVRAVEEKGRLVCTVDKKFFECPDYQVQTSVRPDLTIEDDDFFGIFKEGDPNEPQVDIYEALNAPRRIIHNSTPEADAEDYLLQRAIEESFLLKRLKSYPVEIDGTEDFYSAGASALPETKLDFERSPSSEELEKALALSRAETEEADRYQKEEEETLRRVLEISLREF